jgi:hypothetical protein
MMSHHLVAEVVNRIVRRALMAGAGVTLLAAGGAWLI